MGESYATAAQPDRRQRIGFRGPCGRPSLAQVDYRCLRAVAGWKNPALVHATGRWLQCAGREREASLWTQDPIDRCGALQVLALKTETTLWADTSQEPAEETGLCQPSFFLLWDSPGEGGASRGRGLGAQTSSREAPFLPPEPEGPDSGGNGRQLVRGACRTTAIRLNDPVLVGAFSGRLGSGQHLLHPFRPSKAGRRSRSVSPSSVAPLHWPGPNGPEE